MAAASYTTPALVANQLKRSLSDDEIAFLSTLITAVQKWIDNKTSTTFLQVSSSSRVYDGGVKNVDIEPCTSITAIEMVDDYGTVYYTLQTFEYVLEPVNFNVKKQIRYRWGKLPTGASRVRVTGQFSSYDGGVPEDIQIAATRLCASLLSTKQLNGLKREALEGHLVEYDFAKFASEDPIVMSILDLHTELLVD